MCVLKQLGKYEALHLPLQIKPVMPADIDTAINLALRARATYQSVQRSAQKNDRVICDIETIDEEGIPIPERTRSGIRYLLDGHQIRPEIEKALIGLELGKTTNVFIQPAPGIDVGRLRVSIKLKAVEEPKVPSLDELLTQDKATRTESQLREQVQSQLEIAALRNAEEQIISSMLDHVVASSQFDATAPATIDAEVEDLISRLRVGLEQQSFSLEQFLEDAGTTMIELFRRWRPEAEANVKRTFAIGAIADAEKLTVSDAEIDAELTLERSSYPENAQEFYRMTASPAFRASVFARLLRRKVEDRLFGIATSAQA